MTSDYAPPKVMLACVRGLQMGCAPLLLRLVSEPPLHAVTSEPPMHAGAAEPPMHAGAADRRVSSVMTSQASSPLTKLHASVSARLVAIEALGVHGAEPPYAPAAVAQLAAVVASTCAEDGGARAVAARALAQLSARAIGGTRALAVAVGSAVGILSVAVQLDPDRYVRGYASEALANVAVLATVHAQSPSAELEALMDTSRRAAEALRASGLAVEVDYMLHHLLGKMRHTCAASAREMRNGSARDDAIIDLAHDAVRWLCCRRRCPITTPENPF